MSRWTNNTGFALAATLCLCLLESRSALAYHTARRHITDGTAYTLPDKKIRVGLWKVQYGVIDPVTVGTYVLPWVILAPNAHAKWRFFGNEKLALSFGGGILYEDTTLLAFVEDEIGPAQILAMPFELMSSYRFDDRFTLSLGPLWTLIRVDGALSTENIEGAGQGAGDNFQASSTFEWRLSRVTALTLHGRYVFFQRQTLGGEATANPDDFTTVDAVASGDEDYAFSGAYSVAVNVVFSWPIFNLRAGLGYGNYNIPALNFVLPDKRFFPELDLYWIW